MQSEGLSNGRRGKVTLPRPVAQALIEANPDRIIWGADWPHPIPYRGMPNDAYLLDQLLDWTDEATIKKS